MYEFFDKHGKIFLAVLGSLLVLVFLLPSNFGRNTGRTAHLGTVGGRAIEPDDVANAHAMLVSLRHLRVTTQDNPVPTPMPDVRFGPGLARELSENGLLFFLLLDEADRAGMVGDEGLVEQLLAPTNDYVADDGSSVKIKDLNPTIKDALRADLRAVLGVESIYLRTQMGAMKISRPLVDDLLARQNQQIKARLALFDAADYAAMIAAPTPDELKRQFDSYANEPAGLVRDTNPFGFGYQLPDRVSVQYVQIPDAEVARSIEVTKSAELWDEDAIIYYQKHPLEFQTEGSPTTQPATRPYTDARADALKKLRAPLIEAKKRVVAARVLQQLTSDAQKAAKSPSTQAAVVAFDVPLSSFDYLQKLLDAVQKQTGVRATAVDPGHALTRVELNALPGLGLADPTDPLAPPEAMAAPSVASYLFDALRPLNAAGTLDLLAPSRVLHGTDGDYVVRVVSAEKAHAPASIDAVADQVDKDVRRSKAYTMAQDAAQAALDKAKTAGGLDKAGIPIITTDWFGSDATTLTGVPAAIAAKLPGPAFTVLQGLTSPAELPKSTLAKLRFDGRAATIEVFAIKTTLDTDAAPRARLLAERELMQQTADSDTLRRWFSLDGVSRRVGYVPEPTTGKPTPEPGTDVPRPTNPLLPG